MSFPVHLASVIDTFDVPFLGNGDLARNGHQCQGSKFHSPNPLVVHPIYMADGTRAVLCANCMDNLHVLRRLMELHDGPLPWTVRREFGNLIRALAERTGGEADDD